MDKKPSRRRYNVDFKHEVVQLALKKTTPISAIAENLGIHSVMLYRWIKEFKNEPEYSFPGNGNLKAPEEEVRRLKKQLRDAEEERDVLKKALGIFSRHEE